MAIHCMVEAEMQGVVRYMKSYSWDLMVQGEKPLL